MAVKAAENHARHAERNQMPFVLSVYAGLRVGEIAALTIGDVAAQSGKARREIKLGAHQTRGSKGSHGGS
jgi:integrase/recombinase XerD